MLVRRNFDDLLDTYTYIVRKCDTAPLKTTPIDAIGSITLGSVTYDDSYLKKWTDKFKDPTSFELPEYRYSDIENVYFNPYKKTVTIKWTDGDVTTVKAQEKYGDSYDPEKGMAMCICKKVFGNTGRYNELFKKYIPGEKEMYEIWDKECKKNNKKNKQ